MFLAALRRSADEDQLAYQPSVFGGDLLGDETAERKAQQVDLGKVEQNDERDRVSRHRRDIVGRLAGRAADAGVVEHDDGTIGGQRVDDGGIPRIDVAREVLQENQRRSGSGAEAAIGEADSVAFHVTGWRRFERSGVWARDVQLCHVILRMGVRSRRDSAGSGAVTSRARPFR